MKKQLFFSLLVLSVCCAGSLPGFMEIKYPDHFPTPVYNFDKNPLTSNKIQLGRALFYDPVLSRDSTISCASCHSPYNAFAHTDHDLSHGIGDEIGLRNAPALFNLAWQNAFMWDGAINHLDVQSLAPISHPKEMGEDLNRVVEKLQNKSIYPALFYQAFGDSLITGEFILKALSQFQLTLVSATAKYDAVKSGAATFSEQESKGYLIFQKNCNACHVEPLFSNYAFANNGLSIDSTLNDAGRWAVTKNDADSLLFKVPSLRNLSYTYPYMHDGRFRKLKEVVSHYNHSVQSHPTLSKDVEKMPQMSSEQEKDLIAFLLTLNDPGFVFDPSSKYPKETLNPGEGF